MPRFINLCRKEMVGELEIECASYGVDVWSDGSGNGLERIF